MDSRGMNRYFFFLFFFLPLASKDASPMTRRRGGASRTVVCKCNEPHVHHYCKQVRLKRRMVVVCADVACVYVCVGRGAFQAYS